MQRPHAGNLLHRGTALKLPTGNGAFRALSYRDYFWFWSSYFVSNVGSWMQSIAMGWLLFDLTGSPLFLGLFSSLRMVLLLSFFIIGGILSDRIDRRKAMLWIQYVAAGTSLVLALLVTTHTIQVWHIFVLGAITSRPGSELGSGSKKSNRSGGNDGKPTRFHAEPRNIPERSWSGHFCRHDTMILA